MSCLLSHDRLLEVKLQGELNETRVVARRDDFSKIAWFANLSGVRVNAGGGNGVQVADGIGKVDLVEKIESFGAEFDVF